MEIIDKLKPGPTYVVTSRYPIAKSESGADVKVDMKMSQVRLQSPLNICLVFFITKWLHIGLKSDCMGGYKYQLCGHKHPLAVWA